MLNVYVVENNALKNLILDDSFTIPPDAIWLDLLEPTREEEEAVERFIGVEVPTREEMNEIEISNRLYQDHDALYLTLTLLAKADYHPENHAVSFVIKKDTIVTIRYTDFHPFITYTHFAERSHPNVKYTPATIFTDLLMRVINRLADILEMIGKNIDTLSYKILNKTSRKEENPDLQEMLELIGNNGDLISKARESMITISRLIAFTSQMMTNDGEEIRLQLATAGTDLAALGDHATFLSGKISFLLDATLGMISIEQNNIIKIFSVASVVFLPPTLVASIYGMNFHNMPELEWLMGYPYAMFLMALSAFIPYAYFKRKKWL